MVTPDRVGTEGRRGVSPAAPGASDLVARLRELHLEMMDAVLSGDGLERVAELAAGATGVPVAIVVPRLGLTVVAGGSVSASAREELGRYVVDRLRDRPARVPPMVSAEVPVATGDDILGAVILVAADRLPDPEAAEYLHLAAVSALTEVAIEEARHEVEQNLRSSLLEELRSRADMDPSEVSRRARRLGCELDHGAVVLCAELTTERPRHVVATVVEEYPGALAQPLDDRVYALLPAGAALGPDGTLEAARRLASRLQRHGTVALSSFYGDVGELHRAIQEAELVLDVMRRADGAIAQDIGQGTYRLLFRVLASHPEEVRSFYEDTVAPIVHYDEQYSTDLAGTLESYLEHNCNMNATAAAIYAHRHTVAYRLDRVKELTGLDPMVSEDRERLGLGLKAYRIIAPQLPR